MSGQEELREAVERLLETDALTGNDEGTPSMYFVDPDNLEYLIATVRDVLAERPATAIHGDLDYSERRGGGDVRQWPDEITEPDAGGAS